MALFLAAVSAGRCPELRRGLGRLACISWPLSPNAGLCDAFRALRPAYVGPSPPHPAPAQPGAPSGRLWVWTKPTRGSFLLPSAARGREKRLLPSREERRWGSGMKELHAWVPLAQLGGRDQPSFLPVLPRPAVLSDLPHSTGPWGCLRPGVCPHPHWTGRVPSRSNSCGSVDVGPGDPCSQVQKAQDVNALCLCRTQPPKLPLASRPTLWVLDSGPAALAMGTFRWGHIGPDGGLSGLPLSFSPGNKIFHIVAGRTNTDAEKNIPV